MFPDAETAHHTYCVKQISIADCHHITNYYGWSGGNRDNKVATHPVVVLGVHAKNIKHLSIGVIVTWRRQTYLFLAVKRNSRGTIRFAGELRLHILSSTSAALASCEVKLWIHKSLFAILKKKFVNRQIRWGCCA